MLMKLWRYGRPIEHLGQRYRLDGMLGSGGMAEVCLAWDQQDQRDVAIKILKSDDMDQDTLNRFMKEAGQIVDWQHPHILRIYENMQVELIDATQGSVLFYIVMEYATGGDLQKRLTQGKPFPLAATFPLFRQLCDAVQYAHEHGVIHRDLKPLNILFRRPATGPEEVVLSDFGLAVQADASHHTFARGGTLAYMAPEQFQGHAQPASDIFALGVILYQLCTGRFPFRRTIQDLARIGDAPAPTRPSLLNPDLPSDLDAAILRSLKELPTERYRHAQEFWDVVALALTTAAQTFPFLAEEIGNLPGETWPYGGSERPPAHGQTSQSELSASFGSVPAELARPLEEGPEARSSFVREKQKALSDLVPNLSLPAYSILGTPNAAQRFATEQNAPRLHEDLREGEASRYRNRPGEAQQNAQNLVPPAILAQGTTTRQRFDQEARSTRSQRGGDLDPAIITFQSPDSQVQTTRTRRPAPTTGQQATRALADQSYPSSDPDHSTSRRQPSGNTRPLSEPAIKIQREQPPRRRKLPLVPLITTVALVLLLVAIFVAASVQGPLLHLLGVSNTTVTLIPRAQNESNTYTLSAVTGTPGTGQIQAHLLTSTAPTQTATATATGSIPGTKATGQLTFINNTANAITIQSATIKGNSGIPITFTGPFTVPANPPTVIVAGIAVNAGTAGNIPTLDISEACCAPNNEIFVKNTAFTGGQDAIADSKIQQADIDDAANPLVAAQTPTMQESLSGQVLSNERVVDGSNQCKPKITANHKAGDLARSATVQVAVTCSEEVYDSSALNETVAGLLQTQAQKDPQAGSAYTLQGKIALTVVSDIVVDATGLVKIQVQATGLWVYHFSQTQLQQLARLIAGKSDNDARDLLLQQPGIKDVQLPSTGSLPSNIDEITLKVAAPGEQ
jgi:serine/threonine protein kinase